MSKKLPTLVLIGVVLATLAGPMTASISAQQFDFDKLYQEASRYSVVVEMQIEYSFGMHTTEHSARFLGVIVNEDGLIILNGSDLVSDMTMPSFAGMTVKTTPLEVEVISLDGDKYEAEYLGVDRFTQIGFVKIKSETDKKFTPVVFRSDPKFIVGRWLAVYTLLPELVQPPLAADIGMISAVAETPEYFPLTVGFSPMQMTSLVFDEDLQPVGVLGMLLDPTSASSDVGGMLDSYGQFDISMLGVITGERLAEIIAEPPEKGQMARGWLGISLQALTPDIAEFWGLDITNGIIVSDVVANSPAQEAGLQVGDVIFEVDGETVDVDREEKVPIFQKRVARLGPGTAVELGIVRTPESDPKKIRLTATLADAPMAASDAPEYKNETLEFGVRDMVLADYMIRQLDADSFAGAVIFEIKQGGPCDIGGLQLGDIIQRIGSDTVANKDDVLAIMETIETEKPAEVIFFIWRRNQTMFVNVKIDW